MRKEKRKKGRADEEAAKTEKKEKRTEGDGVDEMKGVMQAAWEEEKRRSRRRRKRGGKIGGGCNGDKKGGDTLLKVVQFAKRFP